MQASGYNVSLSLWDSARDQGWLTQWLCQVKQPGRQLGLGQQDHALQGQQRQLRGPLLRLPIQAGSWPDSRRERGQDEVPGERMQQVHGAMVRRQQVCAQVSHPLCTQSQKL